MLLVATKMALKKFAFPRSDRVLQKYEFDRVFKSRNVLRSQLFDVRWVCSSDGSRFGQIIPKKVGNAVARNAVRRMGRELFRLQPKIPNVDLVVLYKKSISRSDLNSCRDELIKLFSKLNLMVCEGAQK